MVLNHVTRVQIPVAAQIMLKIIYCISIISGTVIGAGLFALPYLTLKVGPLIMLAYFIVLGLIAILIHYFFAELALRTKDYIRLPGFARHYLGKKGYKIALFSGIMGMFGACLVYLIIGGEFLAAIFNGEPLFFTILYALIGSAIIYFGIKVIDKVQFWSVILFFVALVVIFIKGKADIDLSSLALVEIDKTSLFLPYGVVFFSLWGLNLIPEAEELLGEKRKILTKIIPISIIVPMIAYLFFILLVTGLTGENTTESALVGLQEFLGPEIASVALFLGFLTTFTSFITQGLTLKKVFWYDLKIREDIAWAITCFIPISFFLLGFTDFIRILGLVGGIMIAIDGILVSLMYQKIKPARSRVLTYPVIFALFLGLLYEIIYSLNIF